LTNQEEGHMLLTNKNAFIYGAGGSIGSAVARAFARNGATVFLASRARQNIDALAGEISASGRTVDVAQVDALDPQAIEQHLGIVANKAGSIDISFNAISRRGDLQGTPLLKMPLKDFTLPIVNGRVKRPALRVLVPRITSTCMAGGGTASRVSTGAPGAIRP
jgi:3-oxoacyl-[acyl-carrier protein] reductase